MADVTVSGLTGASLPLQTSDLIMVSRGGSVVWKATIANLLALIGAGSGDVVGPASATDNTLPRYNGTTGKLIQGSGVVVSDANEISEYLGLVKTISASTYTLLAADSGKILKFTYNGAIAVTVPNSLAVGWAVTAYITSSAGVATFTAATDALVQNRQSHTKSAGQFSPVSLACLENSDGSHAVVILGGDTAA